MKSILTTAALMICWMAASPSASRAEVPEIPKNLKPGEYIKNIIPMRQRVQMMERAWKWKKEHVLPLVMRELNVDMWIVRNNEADLYYNNEGPVYSSLLPADFQGMTLPSTVDPDRRGVGGQELPLFMMFRDTGDEIEYIEPADYEHITELVSKHDPKTIAIGQDNNEELLAALGSEYGSRSIDSWLLGIRWLETMSPDQIEMFRYVMGVNNDLVAEGFSNIAITPGVTTSDDLNWWFRHRMRELGIEKENHPSIKVRRRPSNIAKYPEAAEEFPSSNANSVVIRRGDIVACDLDINLLGLVTDTHQFAYVLQEGESEVPEALAEALIKANRMQDLISKEFVVGRTGKEIEDASHAIPSDDDVTNTSGKFLSFHPPAMYLRRYQLFGFMFWKGSYVAGIASWPKYYPTSIVSDQHTLSVNTVHVFHPGISINVMGWGEDGVGLGRGQNLGVGQIIAFTEENGFEYLNRSQQHSFHVVR